MMYEFLYTPFNTLYTKREQLMFSMAIGESVFLNHCGCKVKYISYALQLHKELDL